MVKKLVIFIWPQFDRDSYCEANLVVRVCHSILRIAFPASTRVRRGITPRIKLISEDRKYNLDLEFDLTET